MNYRRFCAFALVSASLALCPARLPGQDNAAFFPLSEIRPGLKGVGRTIFEGNKIEEFQVEIRGVLKNALAPKHDAILARLSGPGVDKNGVVAGMSGSPVYVDGKLVGAVAIAFPFAKEPYAVITPIRDMLGVAPAPPRVAGSVATGLRWRIAPSPGGQDSAGRLIPDVPTDPAGWLRFLPAPDSGYLADFRLPLRFAGFSSELIREYTPVFRQLGFEPVASDLGLTGAPVPPSNVERSPSPSGTDNGREVVPGSMISLMLVRGDLNLNVDCTVTYRDARNLYACGHQILLAGPAAIPFAKAEVLATIPSLASSFKVDAPGPVVGSIYQDRFGAIYGVLGGQAPSIPFHMRVESTLNRQEDYHFELVDHPVLTPLLANLAVISTLSATERAVGPSTFNLSGNIRLSTGETVDVTDVVSSDFGAVNAAGAAVATPLTYLLSNDFPDLHITGIDLKVISQDQDTAARLEQAWSSRSQVRPGDHIEVTVVLRTPAGGSVMQKIPVEIPASVHDKTLSLTVGGGTSINFLQNRFTPLASPPRDAHQLVRLLNRMRRDNQVYALLMSSERSFTLQGEEFPSPPPSLVQTIMSAPGVSNSVTFSSSSVVGDYETKPMPYAIEGQQTLYLKVLGNEGRP
jgi:hypothetical protein